MSIIPIHFQILQGLAISFALCGPRPVIQLPSFSLPSFEMLHLRPVQLLSLPPLADFELNRMLTVSGCLAVLVLAYLYLANAFVKPSSTIITLTPIAPPQRFSSTDYLPLAVATPLSRSRQQTSHSIRQSPGEVFPIQFGVSQLSVGPGYYHQSSSLFSRPSTLASSTTPKLEQIIHNAKVDQLSDTLSSLSSLSQPDVEPVNDALDAMSISRPHIINHLDSLSISFEQEFSSFVRSRRATNNPVCMSIPKTAIVDPAHNDFGLHAPATTANPSPSRRIHTSTAQRKVASRRRRLAATPKDVVVAPSTPPTSTPPRAPAQPATPAKPSSGPRLHTSTSSKKVASRRRRLATTLAKTLQKSEVSSSIPQTSTPIISIPAHPRGILKSYDSSSVRVPKNVHFQEFQVITIVPRVDDESINWPFRGQSYQTPHRMPPLRYTSSTGTSSTRRSIPCGKVGHNRDKVDGRWCCSLVPSKVHSAPIRPPRTRR